ncbi:MAG: hypothetical protein ACK5P1_10815, partial [Sphingobacteriia bacterium]
IYACVIMWHKDGMIIRGRVFSLNLGSVVDNDVILPHLEGWNQRIPQVRDMQALMHNKEDGLTSVMIVICQATRNDSARHRAELGVIRENVDCPTSILEYVTIVSQYSHIGMAVEIQSPVVGLQHEGIRRRTRTADPGPNRGD